MQDQKTQFLNPQSIIQQIGLDAGMQVADLGCGTGYMSFAASRVVGEKGKIFAVDVQKPVLGQVKKEIQVENIQNIETIWSDVESLGSTAIAEHTIDMVFLVNILFLVNNKKAPFAEAVRLLNPQGKLLVVEWKKGNTSIGPAADKRVDLASIRKTAQEAGFSEEKEINAGMYHFGVLFKI